MAWGVDLMVMLKNKIKVDFYFPFFLGFHI